MKKILVAGAEIQMLELMIKTLTRSGIYTVIGTSTMIGVYSALKHDQPDLVIMHDLGQGWIEVAQGLHRDGPPVLLTTSFPGVPEARRLMSPKPHELLEVVAEMLAAAAI